MDEKELQNFYNIFGKAKKNIYQDDISLDLLEVAKEDLDRIGIQYKQVVEKNKKRLYLYDNGDQILRYTRSFYPNNSTFGFKIANNKILTEKYLKYADIPTTNSKVFTEPMKNEAKNFVLKKQNRLVMKPLSMEGGAGVFIDITSQNFDLYWNKCLAIQKKRKFKKPMVLIQDFIPGFEVRMIVIEGKFLSATLRVPAHVLGDGIMNIKELIEEKNIVRKENPFLKSQLIKINDDLNNRLYNKGLTLDSVLEKNEFCVLYPQSNTQLGGENIEITHLIKDDLKILCEKVAISLPGLHTIGIDLMIETFDSEQGIVLEVNKAPAFLLNYYPYIGEQQRPMKDIFRTYQIESRLLRNKLDFEKMNKKEIEIIQERYKFNYLKQQRLEQTIKKLEEENEQLKKSLDLL